MKIKEIIKKYKAEIIGGVSGVIVWAVNDYRRSNGTESNSFFALKNFFPFFSSLSSTQRLLFLLVGGIIAGIIIKNLWRRFSIRIK